MPKNPDQSKTLKKPNFMQRLESIYFRHSLLIWLTGIFLPIIVIAIGCIVFPEIFYDQFVWRYFWGTIEADAQEETYGDVTEAYNPVNTIVYGLIVIVVIYWIYKSFKRFEISFDFKFFIAIIPFIIVGGVARALEDAELFYTPTAYLFIAPIIYIFIGIVVIGLIFLSTAIIRFSNKTGLQTGFQLVAGVFIALDIIYLFTYFILNHQFSYILNPLAPVIISIIILLGFYRYTASKKRFEVSIFIFSVGLWFLSLGTIVLCQWQTVPSWTQAYISANPGNDIQLRPFAFVLVAALTIIGTIIVYITARALAPKYERITPYLAGINLTLFFGHFLDASATFIAIDYYGYAEKHVLPVFMIQIFNTAAIMYVLKALIIICVVYFIDILYKKDFQSNPTLTGLVKIAILVLGLGPGIRDVLRLSLGV